MNSIRESNAAMLKLAYTESRTGITNEASEDIRSFTRFPISSGSMFCTVTPMGRLALHNLLAGFEHDSSNSCLISIRSGEIHTRQL